MMQEGGLNCITGMGKSNGRLIILLDISKLLESQGTINMEPAGEPKVHTHSRAAAQAAAAGSEGQR